MKNLSHDWTTVREKRKASRTTKTYFRFVQLFNRWMSKDDWRSANLLVDLPSMPNRFSKEKFFSTKSLFNCIETKFVSPYVSLCVTFIRCPSKYSDLLDFLEFQDQYQTQRKYFKYSPQKSHSTRSERRRDRERETFACLDGNGRFKWFSTNKFDRVFRHSNGKRSNRRWRRPKNIANSIRNGSHIIESVETKRNRSKSVLSFLFEDVRNESKSIEDFRETIGSLQSGVQSTSDRNSSRKGEIREEERFVLGKNLSLVEFNKHRATTTRFSSSPISLLIFVSLPQRPTPMRRNVSFTNRSATKKKKTAMITPLIQPIRSKSDLSLLWLTFRMHSIDV